jgi:lipoprotein-anchoring transpeptidase ErfK/SrfK
MKGFTRFALAAALAAFGALAPPGPAAAREMVRYESSAAPGTIVIDTQRRRLFLIQSGGRAISYPIGVPKAGWEWSGSASVNGKYVRPDWAPPPAVRVEQPRLPDRIRGGSPNNPMGARAITLDRSEVAIHGSTQRMRATIGSAASHGCIRMRNEDVIDLYDRVHIGTPVLMLP